MAVALSVCCASAFPSFAETGRPAVFFDSLELFSDGNGGMNFDSQQCLANTMAGEHLDEFFFVVMPAGVEAALLGDRHEFWSPNNPENLNIGILNCEAEETSWGVVKTKRIQLPNRTTDIDKDHEDLKEYLEGLASDTTLTFSTAPNNVAQSCTCAFLASDAWQQYKRDFIADPSNYNAGGN